MGEERVREREGEKQEEGRKNKINYIKENEFSMKRAITQCCSEGIYLL